MISYTDSLKLRSPSDIIANTKIISRILFILGVVGLSVSVHHRGDEGMGDTIARKCTYHDNNAENIF